MVQLTQAFAIYILCGAVVNCHVLLGNNQHRVHHDFSELPQIISHFINQHLGHGYLYPYNQELNRPGLPGSGNINFGSSPYDISYNRPSNIFGGNLFGSPDYTNQEGPFSSEESGEPLLHKPNSDEDVPNIQISQVPPISVGMNGEIFDGNLQDTSNIHSVADIPNGQNEDLTGQGIVDNLNANVPNIQIPQEEINVGIGKNPVSGVGGSTLSAAQDSTNVDINSPGEVITTVSPVVGLGLIGLPNSVGDSEHIEGNKHDVSGGAAIADQDTTKLNLNSSSDSISDSNLHVNVPVNTIKQTDTKVVVDSSLQNTIKDIFKLDDQSILNMGIDEPKVSLSGNSSQKISNSDVKVPDVSTNMDEKFEHTESSVPASLLTDNSTLGVKIDKDQDSKLKTNQVVQSANADSDIMISKHKDKTSIVFPDKLNEAKNKIQKQKNESQLSKLNDVNVVDGQILYAVNIGPSIVPSNQGFYVSPTSTDNGQKVYVNSPSGTPAQYVPQNPSTVSNTVPSENIVSTNANGGSTSGGYTMVNVPTNGNINSGQAMYSFPTSSAGQSNSYYQVPSNPTQQAYYTVQLSNGQIALVPVSSGQYVQTNAQGQLIVPSNGQQYVISNGQPVQSTGQIVYSNGQQYVPTNGQPMQGNSQIVVSSNGQQYVPSNGQQYVPSNGQQYVSNNGQQSVPSNGQQYVQSNGQQYVPSNGQPMQGNSQVIVTNNGQQYIPSSSQPMQGNDQILVSSNGQQYVQAGAQPTQSNGQIVLQGNGQPTSGQYIVSSNGQHYVPSVSVPWSQGTVQSNGQVYIPINNQNPPNNIVTVPAGSIVTVGDSTSGVPLMVFKEKDESSPKDSPSGDEKDDEIDKEKDEIRDEIKNNIKGKMDKAKLKINNK